MPEMPFEPGKSGNPAGKLKGTRNKTTLAVEALLDGEAETITRKAIELAKDGDLAALRLCLDRIAPPRKDRPVLFELPPVSSAADAAKAAAALLEAVAARAPDRYHIQAISEAFEGQWAKSPIATKGQKSAAAGDHCRP
jgi:hypothetical protein